MGLMKLPRVKIEPHYADSKTAYRLYAEMLKKEGIYAPKKLFEFSTPLNIKSRLYNDTEAMKARRPKDLLTKQKEHFD